MPAKKKRVRVGFIGGGGIARFQMSLLKQMPDVDIVAVSDVSQDALDTCVAQYTIPHTFTDYRKVLEMKGIDAVSVCTPNYLHHKPTIDALEAGKDVIVEKPMAMNVPEAREMVDAAKRTGRLLVIGFQYRYSPAAQMIKRYIDAGEIGPVMYARCHALRRRGIPNWGVFTRKDLQGGGPMIDIGVHIIEVAHYLMGSPRPVSVFGSTYTYLGDKKSDVASSWPGWDYRNYTVEDLAVGIVKFENGATLSVEASFAAHIPNDEHNFVLMGEKGGAQYSPPMVFKDEAGTMVNVTPGFLPKDEAFFWKMRHFMNCVMTGRPSEAPGEHGLMVQMILDGVYRSAETGKEVTFD